MQETQNLGQFLEIRVSDKIDPLLRRPISIHNVNGNVVDFVFQVKGKGTEILSSKEVGEEIDIMGPLGSGTFELKDKKNIAIIGGGIGIFPLYEFVKQAKNAAKVNMYLGFRNKDFVVLEEEYRKVSDKFILTTDDRKLWRKRFCNKLFKGRYRKRRNRWNLCMWTTSNA